VSTAHPAQPEGFSFSDENRQAAQSIIAKFPEGRQASAVLPLLDLAQRQNDGWLPAAAIETVADLLDMAPIRVWEVATFYSMYNLKPVGRHLVQVCTNISCWLRGADQVVEVCQRRLGIGIRRRAINAARPGPDLHQPVWRA
jgi:NADH:ubiquinone oxidoreductase subunit E